MVLQNLGIVQIERRTARLQAALQLLALEQTLVHEPALEQHASNPLPIEIEDRPDVTIDASLVAPACDRCRQRFPECSARQGAVAAPMNQHIGWYAQAQ